MCQPGLLSKKMPGSDIRFSGERCRGMSLHSYLCHGQKRLASFQRAPTIAAHAAFAQAEIKGVVHLHLQFASIVGFS